MEINGVLIQTLNVVIVGFHLMFALLRRPTTRYGRRTRVDAMSTFNSGPESTQIHFQIQNNLKSEVDSSKIGSIQSHF